MATNPYQPTTNSTGQTSRAGIARYWIGFTLAMTAGFYMAIPAALLLNLEWQFIPGGQSYPTTVHYYEFELFGYPLSNSSAFTWSLALSGLCFITGLTCAAIGVRNGRKHRIRLEQ